VIVIETLEGVRALTRSPVGLVPTMGFLHEGHLGCVAAIADRARTVVMSLFVNPIQFDSAGDLARYPRDLERDAALAEDAGVEVLFVPSLTEMYPVEPATRVHVAGVTDAMEGAHRPGHFDGVATVVAKLFAGIQPDVAAFGRKDAQQLAVVTTMSKDLSFPVEILGVPTVREEDGLALSSRNVRIEDREAALGLSQGLLAAADAVEAGERDGAPLEAIVSSTASAAGAVVQYATLAARDTAQPIARLESEAFLAVAATVGDVRLIDNVFLGPDGSADRGTRLDRPSVLYREGR